SGPATATSGSARTSSTPPAWASSRDSRDRMMSKVPGGPAVRGIAKVLKAFCFVLTASLAVFVLLNVFAAYWLPLDTPGVLAGQPVFNDRLRSVYEAIYGLPIAVIRQIIAECYAENAWIFEPYVQFREQPRRGRYVNISAEGFRLNGATGRTTVDTTGSI